MSNEISIDPFTTKGVLTFPELSAEFSQAWHGFKIDTQLKAGLLKLADPDDIKLDVLRSEHLKLSRDFIPLPDIDTPQSSSPGSAQESPTSQNGNPSSQVQHKEDTFDLWQHHDIREIKSESKLISWDHFLDVSHETTKSVYLSEAGPRVFDALLRAIVQRSDGGNETGYAKLEPFLRALRELAFGRESVFFEWDAEVNEFRETNTNCTISGVSRQLLDQIIQKFISQGRKYRLLATFRSSKISRGPLPLAFASILQDVLHAIENFVDGKLGSRFTLLKLQNTFEQPFDLIDAIHMVADIFQRSADVTQTVQSILDLDRNGAIVATELEPIIGQVIGSTLQPYINAIIGKIGVVSSVTTAHDLFAPTVDNVLSQRTASLLDSASTSLQLLQKACPERLSVICRLPQTHLQFCRTWDQVSQQQQGADRHESIVSHVLTNMGSQNEGLPLEQSFGQSDPRTIFSPQTDKAFDFQTDLFDGTTSHTELLLLNGGLYVNDLMHVAFNVKSEVLPAPQLGHRQALELSLLPILTAQHRLLSFAAYQNLFMEHKLLAHLQSLHRFHLISDGPFSARLSMALFNSERATGELNRQKHSSSGLRLQNRDTWPPASSELRLVLMGILSESMSDVRSEGVVEATSFAIRDLPDEELERCRDLNSIYALDFLCLHYKAPNSVIGSIITTKALKRYDRIFMHLLRLFRVKDLAQYLLRRTCARYVSKNYSSAERKLRHDMHHFTVALANYSHHIAVDTHWHRFEKRIQAIQSRLDSNDYSGTLELANSMDHLRNMHEKTLNDISGALLLRKKQSEARTNIEDIFGIILRYAALEPTFEEQEHITIAMKTPSVTTIQVELDSKVKFLIGYLRSITALQTGDDDTHMAEQLLLALDHAGYYTKKQSK